MFIELIGLPGAGKTTLARALHSLDPEAFEHVKVDHRKLSSLAVHRPIRLATIATRILPLAVMTLGRSQLGFSARKRLAPVPPLINELIAFEEIAKRTRDGSSPVGHYVFEEFLLQRVLSAFGYSRVQPSERAVATAVHALHARGAYSTLAVFIDVDAETARSRVLSRSSGVPERMRGLDEHEVSQIYDCHRVVLQMLSHLSPHSLHLDGDADPRQNARVIARRVGE